MTTIPKRRRRPPVGSLRDRVVISTREIDEPAFGDPDFDVLFRDDRARWAQVNTTTGRTLFASATRGDVPITHVVIIRYDPTVNESQSVLLETGERLEIVRAEALDQRREWTQLSCSSTGFPSASEASKV